MTGSVDAPTPVVVTALRPGLVRRLARNPVGMLSLAFLALVVLAAIAAPLLTSFDPETAAIRSVRLPPGGEHLLGTDNAGRDVWARLLYGARYTLAGAALATAVAAILGITAGLVAGYYGRAFSAVSGWVVSLLMALPGILVLLASRSVLGSSLWIAMLIFGILLAPAFYRLVHASVTAVRSELYVDAARVSGVGDASIIARHVLVVVRAPIIIQASIVICIAISIQAGLDFLGFGDASIPTWGNVLNDAFQGIYNTPVLLLWPSLAVALTCIALTLFANALRDELERTTTRTGARRRAGRSPAPGRQAGGATVTPPAPTVPGADGGTGTGAGIDSVLRIEQLSVGYRQPDDDVVEVVHDVSLDIPRGRVHGLIGESGSGKTQTAWSVLRLLPPGGEILGGRISFEGRDLAHIDESAMRGLRGRRIGYIPQEPMSNLAPAFTVGTQLVDPMRSLLGLSARDARERALHLLERVGIPEPDRVFRSYSHQLSGGMAQRVLIAGSISCDPALLIADEPTTALDVTVQAEILDLLRDVQCESGMAVLLVTHNFGVVADLCDDVSVMQKGHIVETGSVLELFDAPRHPYTRSLFDSILEGGEARGPLGARPIRSGDPA